MAKPPNGDGVFGRIVVNEAYVNCAWCFTDGQESTVHKREARSHKVPQKVRRLWCLWEVLPEAPPSPTHCTVS